MQGHRAGISLTVLPKHSSSSGASFSFPSVMKRTFNLICCLRFDLPRLIIHLTVGCCTTSRFITEYVSQTFFFLKRIIVSLLQLHWKRLLDRIFHDNFSEDEEIVVLATDYIQKVSDIIKTTSKR